MPTYGDDIDLEPQPDGTENTGIPEPGSTAGMNANLPMQPAEMGHPDLTAASLENQSNSQDLAEELVLIDHINYADRPDVVTRFDEEVISKLISIEDQRIELEDLWSECEDIWLRKNNGQSRYYTGVNDAYMPTGFRAIETHVQHVMSQLFPLIFAVVAKLPFIPPEAVQRATSLLEQDLLQADVETKFEPFVRQSFIYGWCVEKTVWKEEFKRNYKLVIDPATNQMSVAAGIKPIKTYCGPTFNVIDPYDIYVHPYDSFTIREASIVHEYIRTSIQNLRQNDAELTGNPRAPFFGVNRLASEGHRRDRTGEEKKNLRNEKYGLRRDQIKGKSVRDMCQIWAKFDLYGDGNIVDCKATVVDGIVIELRQNPLKCQEPPYRLWSPFNTSRHIYKMGMCEIMRVLVYILNAIMNQMLDANLFQTNQMMAIDTNRYQGRPSDIEITPFGILPIGGVGPVRDAVEFFKPEMNLQQTILAANLIAAAVQDSIAASTTMQGKFSGKERTKGEVEMVTGAAMTGVSAMVRSLSINVLAKWFEDSLELERQYRDPMDVAKIAGVPDFKFPFEDREHEYYIRVLTTPEAEQFKMAQAQAQATQAGAPGEENSNPTGINGPGGANPQGFGGENFGESGV